MFPDSLANMWAFSRQPGRGPLRTELQNILFFVSQHIYHIFSPGWGISKKVEAYANASRLRNLPKLSKWSSE
jgi:hypothetical protein